MSAPSSKPAPKQRAKATWTVYERVVVTHETHLEGGFDVGTVLLVEVDPNVVERTAGEACWHVAETTLLERARGDDPPLLCASRNGTAYGLSEVRPYALKPTVERVK